MSSTFTTRFESARSADVVEKLLYYFGFFIDNIVSYARRDPYLLVTYRLQVTERREGSCVVRWGYPSLLRHAYVNIVLPKRASIYEGRRLK